MALSQALGSEPELCRVLGLLQHLTPFLLKERKVFFNYSGFASELLLAQSLFWLREAKNRISKVEFQCFPTPQRTGGEFLCHTHIWALLAGDTGFIKTQPVSPLPHHSSGGWGVNILRVKQKRVVLGQGTSCQPGRVRPHNIPELPWSPLS